MSAYEESAPAVGADFSDIPKPGQLTPSERARLESVEGIVFDIQRYSLHDGPGLRTNVFLKGCPLYCKWCANPESQHLGPELALFAHNCMSCGQFDDACPACLENQNGVGWREKLGEKLGRRVEICPTGAIHWIGERRTAAYIMEEVLRDVPFYEDGGGMTLTGGEPTLQPDLAAALLRLAQADCISTALETCGHTRWEVLERLLPYLDDILFDVKHMDSATHLAFTGLGNELILSNLRQLVACGAPLTIRLPLIPGFNASPESVQAIAEFVKRLDGSVKAVDVLPYHTLGKAKYKALGREYPWEDHDRLIDAEVEALTELVASYGLRVKTGG
jgi:pyruvate formate lyase activating enzyme